MKARISFASISLVLFIAFATGGRLYAQDDDWGDLPDSFNTLAANNGAFHLIGLNPTYYMGILIDPEADGQPSASADGDDLNNSDDEDGVVFNSLFVPGQVAKFDVTVSLPGQLDVWMDLDSSGTWTSGDHIIAGQALNAGINSLSFNVPVGTALGQNPMRFRFVSAASQYPGGAAIPTGGANDGEVEDYVVEVKEEGGSEYSHKMHYPQLPDPNGWDVCACFNPETGFQKVLADDFRCTSNGPITKITFWGSFKDDFYMHEEPFHGIINFHLSLHKDIPDPDGPGPEYSKPVVPAEWEKEIDPYNLLPGWIITVHPEEPSDQGWYDPNTGEVLRPNHQDYFRYEVTIPAIEAFIQTEGEIYWLDISTMTHSPQEPIMWGWKTSVSPHFNDDAVWADLPIDDSSQWNELRDPIEPEISLDLAFIIDGGEEEPTKEFDWGDAPDQPYPTLAANNGANHFIAAGMFLGAAIDAELDGQPDATATGDDLANLADEDGVVFTSLLVPGAQATLTITASMAGQMDAWIDYNDDGDWMDAGEQLKGGTFALAAGVNTINIAVPASATPTASTFARFRFSSAGGLPPTGSAPDGEVEDYEIQIDELDWGDAPDPTYPTFAASIGAHHLIPGGSPLALRLGWLIDGEPDGQPNANATGDVPDEDGITFDTPLIPGTVAQITAYAGVNAAAAGFAFLDGWIDFNNDGTWGPAEQIFTSLPLTFTGLANPTVLTFNVPAGATPSPTFARFRLSTTSGLLSTGFASDGEVEDYLVDIADAQPIDWGDAYDNFMGMVFPTLQMHNGAHHVIMPGMFLGTGVDSELDGQPTLPANGDDTNANYPGIPYPPGDEDGVVFTSLLQPGGYAGVDVVASQPGMLDAWIDFNNDGDWADSGEQIFTLNPLNPGANSLLFAVPLSAVQGMPVVSRFRYTSGGVATYKGLALDGEVEDYLVDIERVEPQGLDFGDAPYVPETVLPLGARHAITPGVVLGAVIDSEPDGQPSAADMDDLMLLDDEDGVTFVGKMVAGSNATINVVAGVSGGMLDAWIDFDADGAWIAPEQLFGGSIPLAPGLNAGITFPVPQPAALGPTFARFRISSAGGLFPTGAAPDGEVEDYMVELFQPQPTNLVITNLTFLASNTVAKVEWTVESGIIYQMQTSTNLMTNVWVDVEAPVVGPLNWQTNNMAAQTNKFYRVTAPWTE